MLRTTATVIALTLFLPTALAQETKSQEITLKGKFVFSEEEGEIVFKAGGKSLAIDLQKVRLQKHRVEKLRDLPAGTQVNVFAKFTPWSDGDEYERMACLVAGDHYVRSTSRRARTWRPGTAVGCISPGTRASPT